MNAAEVSKCQFSPREPTSAASDRHNAVLLRAPEKDGRDEEVVPHPEELKDPEGGKRGTDKGITSARRS